MTEERSDASSPERAGVSLLDLTPGQCRFILREGRPPVRFCREPTASGGSWCAEHRRIVYRFSTASISRADLLKMAQRGHDFSTLERLLVAPKQEQSGKFIGVRGRFQYCEHE